ncbi:MAG: macro domain-containing protein [Faecalibacterium sp.]|nr:macro domain-containing protein [Faecalibacterium sp.]
MPFEIVRNDITVMQVDAIVNPASRSPVIGYGCDAGIHQKAGPPLLQARQKLGCIEVGQAAATRGYGLPARYVLHAVGPVWQGGSHGEEQLLRQCYDNTLALALRRGCRSVAFPLLGAGNHGFPTEVAMQIAIAACSSFLMQHEMQIYLVVFNRSAFTLSEKLFHSVASYIDEHYILSKTLTEYNIPEKQGSSAPLQLQRDMERRRLLRYRHSLEEMSVCEAMPAAPPAPAATAPAKDLKTLLEHTDAGFSETLLRLIDRSGKKDSAIYKKANVDRKLFSKIRSNPGYKPSKSTALAFAVALELDLDETLDLIGRAGYTLTRSSKFDIIVQFFIETKQYDIYKINLALFQFDQRLLGE